jgi:hypothetical protein
MSTLIDKVGAVFWSGGTLIGRSPIMSYQDRTREIKAGRLLDVIRERPALYLGEHSLTGLWHYLHGYHLAEHIHEIEAVSQLPKDFHDWVAYRLHYFESTSGWRRMILDQIPDERAALERFYELLEEHRSRQPRIVATIQGHQRAYKTCKQGQDLSEAIQKLMPEIMTLVAYTDDPGLFLTCEGNSDFPGKDRLFYPQLGGIAKEMIKVLDHEAFNRWLAEDRRGFMRTSASTKPSNDKL